MESKDILNRLHGSKVFSKVDLKDAYLQIPLDQSSSILTTINIPFALFKYNFLPFDLSCSPAIFQEVMSMVLNDLEGVEVHQDDFIVHGTDKIVHELRLIALLRCLIEQNIAVNPNKCSFCASSFECLGYLVDGNGFRPDMKRLAPLCVSRKLTVNKQGYSQTQREALAVFQAGKRLHKYLFGKKFTIVTNHKALKFIYHPEKFLARSSVVMVQ
ncbi:unnamed protein product [Schistosoma rodhaini]|uniref:Reverse transcriptase domain-containing protein n=1 Tax=Schistosoma rodhaini TaxID=6188 RepID=A0AA85G0Y9_9TREM|nr:unnamed protein product [Schistosoma rodhaini]